MKQAMVVLLLVTFAVAVFAAPVEQVVSFQGKIVESGTPPTGTRNIEFKLYDVAIGGAALWTENHLAVPVTAGLFNVELGAATTFASAGVDFSEQYWVGISVAGGTEIVPRYKLTNTPYAMADGDWQVDGTDMYSLSTGNVGIGTTIPEAPLHIDSDDHALYISGAGAISTTSFEGLGFQYFWGSGEGAIMASFPTGSGYLTFHTTAGGTMAERMRISHSGDVGIGTDSPGAKLEVSNGTTSLQVKPGILGDVANASWVTLDVPGYNSLYIWDNLSVNDNLGIGTTSPSQKLHVSGNVRVTGAYYDSGNSPGTAGQVLSSTVTGTDWIAASGGGLWEDAGDYINPVGTVSDNIKVADVQDYEYGFYSDMNTGTALGYGGRFEHTTSGNGSYGIRAEANYTGAGNTSYTYGGFFRSTSTSQDGYGVYVDVDNASGSGGWAKGVDVNVDNNGTSYSFGIEIDVNNEGTSACGVDIDVDNNGTTTTHGIEIDVDNEGSTAYGVDIDVDNNGTTFPTYGVKVDAYGMNSAGTGDCFAGDFYGRKISTATSGDSYGVYARATYGVNAFGVYARTYDEADNQYPVCGFQEGYDESDWGGYEPGGFFGGAYGVIGITKASSGTGVRGIAELTGTGTGYGVRGSASGGTTHYGVYGSASGGTTNYGVYCSGSGAYTGTWTDVSDRKFKKNITPMTGILAKVLDLNPVTYEMRTDEYNFMGFSEGTEYGLIAQELNEVFPELVKHGVHPGEEGGEPVEYEGIDYISLTSILVQGMQEQQAQIETQQAQIEELRSEIETLKNNQ